MVRTAKPKKEVSMEEALWKNADKFRGSVEPAEYKYVVLSLFFLKFAGDIFDVQKKMIAKQYGEKFMDTVAFYTKDNVFYLPEESRWSYLMEKAKQDDIALKIDTALYTIEKKQSGAERRSAGQLLFSSAYRHNKACFPAGRDQPYQHRR